MNEAQQISAAEIDSQIKNLARNYSRNDLISISNYFIDQVEATSTSLEPPNARQQLLDAWAQRRLTDPPVSLPNDNNNITSDSPKSNDKESHRAVDVPPTEKSPAEDILSHAPSQITEHTLTFNSSHKFFAAKLFHNPQRTHSTNHFPELLVWLQMQHPTPTIWRSFKDFTSREHWLNDTDDIFGFEISHIMDCPFYKPSTKEQKRDDHTSPHKRDDLPHIPSPSSLEVRTPPIEVATADLLGLPSGNPAPSTPAVTFPPSHPPTPTPFKPAVNFSSIPSYISTPFKPTAQSFFPQNTTQPSAVPLHSTFPSQSLYNSYLLPPKELKFTTTDLSKEPSSWYTLKSEIEAKCSGPNEAHWLSSGTTTPENAHFSTRLGGALILHIKGSFMTRIAPPSQHSYWIQHGIELFHLIKQDREKTYVLENNDYAQMDLGRAYYQARQGSYQKLDDWIEKATFATEKSFPTMSAEEKEQATIRLVVSQCNETYSKCKLDIYKSNKKFSSTKELYKEMMLATSSSTPSNSYNNNTTNKSNNDNQSIAKLQKELASLKNLLSTNSASAYHVDTGASTIPTEPSSSTDSSTIASDSPALCYAVDSGSSTYVPLDKSRRNSHLNPSFRLPSSRGKQEQNQKAFKENLCLLCFGPRHDKIEDCPEYNLLLGKCKLPSSSHHPLPSSSSSSNSSSSSPPKPPISSEIPSSSHSDSDSCSPPRCNPPISPPSSPPQSPTIDNKNKINKSLHNNSPSPSPSSVNIHDKSEAVHALQEYPELYLDRPSPLPPIPEESIDEVITDDSLLSTMQSYIIQHNNNVTRYLKEQQEKEVQTSDDILECLRLIFNESKAQAFSAQAISTRQARQHSQPTDIDEILEHIHLLYEDPTVPDIQQISITYADDTCKIFKIPSEPAISPLELLTGNHPLYNNDPYCLGVANKVDPNDFFSVSEGRIVADSGCTFNMDPNKSAFITKIKTPDSYVIVANGHKLQSPFLGLTLTKIDGKVIKRMALYVPELATPLYSIRQHVQTPNCSFHVLTEKTILKFPHFSLDIPLGGDYSLPYSTLSGNIANRYCDYVEPYPAKMYKNFNFALAVKTRQQRLREAEQQQQASSSPSPPPRKYAIDEPVEFFCEAGYLFGRVIEHLPNNKYKVWLEDNGRMDLFECKLRTPLHGIESFPPPSTPSPSASVSSPTSVNNIQSPPSSPPAPSVPPSPSPSASVSSPPSDNHNKSPSPDVTPAPPPSPPAPSVPPSDSIDYSSFIQPIEYSPPSSPPPVPDDPDDIQEMYTDFIEDRVPDISPERLYDLQHLLHEVQRCVAKYGKITPKLQKNLELFYARRDPTPKPSSSTPSDRPFHIPSLYKPNSSESTSSIRHTPHDLHRLLGRRVLKNWKSILQVAQPNLTIPNTGEPPLELGNMVNVSRARRNNTPVPLPSGFFDTCHCDIGFGDDIGIGGTKYVLLLVDRATKFGIIEELKGLDLDSLKHAFLNIKKQFKRLPSRILTDFDLKLIGQEISDWLIAEHECSIFAAPSGRQSQNGLCENRWKVLVHMARAYITDKQMPKAFWFYALRHANLVNNIIPVTVDGTLTTPFELTFGSKPDYALLDPLFATCSFHHEKDGNRARGKFESHNMLGILLGRSSDCDGHLIYNPHNKQFYNKTGCKIDINRNTPNAWNLKYDGGLFVGLLDSKSSTVTVEPFPLGTPLTYKNKDGVRIRGTVISVPTSSQSHLDSLHPPQLQQYGIRLVTEEVVQLPLQDMLEYTSIPDVSPDISPQTSIALPSWIQPKAKVQYLKDGIYLKGILDFNTDDDCWHFLQKSRSIILTDYKLPNFALNFQSLVADAIIVPGWKNLFNFSTIPENNTPPTAFHVDAQRLAHPFAPSSLAKALDPTNPDHNVWLESYDEEFNSLLEMDTFELITHEEYQALLNKGKCQKAIPTMCVLTVKKNNGVPVRAKSRIVVLGNRDTRDWKDCDTTAPVVSQESVRVLAALAVQDGRILKQGDCKNAFVQSYLPDNETTVCRPPPGCPHSVGRKYWLLRKSLYGLKRAPRHWYNLCKKYLEQCGLHNTTSDRCLFTGTVIEGEPPLHLAIYVDDFVYYSKSDKVEKEFERRFGELSTVDFMGQVDWYLGMKFRWVRDEQDSSKVTCYISQEGYVDLLAQKMGITEDNIPKKAMPYKSGFPIDAIPKSPLPRDHPVQKKIAEEYRSYVGMLGWLAGSTRPDVATAHSLLSTYLHCPTNQHIAAAKHVGRYLLSTKFLCIAYSNKTNDAFHSYVQYPPDDTIPTAFSDGGWGPIDSAFTEGKTVVRPVHPEETCAMQGYCIYLSGGPISWKATKEKRTSQSSCESEVKSVNECTKQCEFIRNLLTELGRALPDPTTIHNDNKGAVDWSNGFSNKNMKWINIRENYVREAIHREHTVTLRHVPGPTNPSDIHTKEHKSYSVFAAVRDANVTALPVCFH